MKFQIENQLTSPAQPRLRPNSWANRSWANRLGRHQAGAIALVIVLLSLSACTGSAPTAASSESETERSDLQEQLADNSDDPTGEVITIAGEIQTFYDKNTFILRNEEYFEESTDLLIINLNDTALQQLSEGEYVQVTGELTTRALTDIEENYAVTWDNELLKEIETEFRDGLVIIATSVFEEELPE